MSFDVAAVRAQFPALASGLAYFDGPGGTQTPSSVGAAIARTITAPLSNRGTITAGERNGEDSVREFRLAYADLLGVAPGGIVHGRSATQLTYDISRALAKTWGAGDEVVVSQLDHDCNVRPWVQDIQQFMWSEEDVNNELRKLMLNAFARVRKQAVERNLSNRLAALSLGVQGGAAD